MHFELTGMDGFEGWLFLLNQDLSWKSYIYVTAPNTGALGRDSRSGKLGLQCSLEYGFGGRPLPTPGGAGAAPVIYFPVLPALSAMLRAR